MKPDKESKTPKKEHPWRKRNALIALNIKPETVSIGQFSGRGKRL